MDLDRSRALALTAALLCLGVIAGIVAWTVLRPGSDRPDFGSRPAAPSAASPPAGSADSLPSASGSPTRRGSTAPARTASRPVRLLIPALGVRAAVDAMGVARDGSMALPPASRVGWYRYGPAPGSAAGSATIAGHIDSRTDGLGVFAALTRAERGQRVTVVDERGRSHRFRMVARRTISKRALPVEELFRRDGPPVLTLITCIGPYDRDRGGYQENLVLTATADRGR
jgi:hypothetical protein